MIRHRVRQCLRLLIVAATVAVPLLRAEPAGERGLAQNGLPLRGPATTLSVQFRPTAGVAHDLAHGSWCGGLSRFSLAGPMPASGDTARRVISARLQADPRKRRDARLSWVFLGTTLLAGGASLCLKGEADERYDRYLRAGSPAAMNRYYDQACRLDRYAAVAYGTFQISFLLWVVFFLKSR